MILGRHWETTSNLYEEKKNDMGILLETNKVVIVIKNIEVASSENIRSLVGISSVWID